MFSVFFTNPFLIITYRPTKKKFKTQEIKIDYEVGLFSDFLIYLIFVENGKFWLNYLLALYIIKIIRILAIIRNLSNDRF